MKLLTQNAKMQKSSKGKFSVYNWTIPAFQSSTGLRTCPNAGSCAAGCYARMGAYVWSNVQSAHEAKLQLTLTDAFVPLMVTEINRLLGLKSTKQLKIRIHDAGDFYSMDYLKRWIAIFKQFETNKRVSFYAYTKQVELLKSVELPSNFTAIYSFGGKQDHMIDVATDRHSRVFETIAELKNAGYSNGTADDMIAAVGKNNKVGLVYHGNKSYDNTKWSKVA